MRVRGGVSCLDCRDEEGRRVAGFGEAVTASAAVYGQDPACVGNAGRTDVLTTLSATAGGSASITVRHGTVVARE